MSVRLDPKIGGGSANATTLLSAADMTQEGLLLIDGLVADTLGEFVGWLAEEHPDDKEVNAMALSLVARATGATRKLCEQLFPASDAEVHSRLVIHWLEDNIGQLLKQHLDVAWYTYLTGENQRLRGRVRDVALASMGAVGPLVQSVPGEGGHGYVATGDLRTARLTMGSESIELGAGSRTSGQKKSRNKKDTTPSKPTRVLAQSDEIG